MMDPKILQVLATGGAMALAAQSIIRQAEETRRRRKNFKRQFVWRKHPKNAQARYVSACLSVAKRAHRFRRNLF